MALPTNIEKEHLLKAIEKIDSEGYDFHAESVFYDVLYNGKRYPPKLLVSWANIFANGSEIDRNTFDGGPGKPAFDLLERLGFVIIKKKDRSLSFSDHLVEFVSVSKKQVTGEGTTPEATAFNKQVPKQFAGLTVDVSFGMGRATGIPWISFLANNQKTSQGIYPVYLFYKNVELLILAYGVSETNNPVVNWNVNNAVTIEQYFLERNLNKPNKYGQSLVFKVYDTSRPLDKDEVDEDLSSIINIYNNIFSSSNNRTKMPDEKAKKDSVINNPKVTKAFDYLSFYNDCQKARLSINKALALRFTASLLTKPFVILTGLSGSGKTKLAQAFALWLCENESQYCIVPVGADWTNREPLLGFPNALKSNEYVKPDNRVLDLIIKANDDREKPYFLILDEMNLSHVERYFADFLSVMESKGQFSLHAGPENWKDVPASINLPENLFIIGTVNIDETTYMFSPKVLDRANVIEFRVNVDEMKSYLDQENKLDLESLMFAGTNMGNTFVQLAKNKSLETNNILDLQSALILFFTELKKTGAEFGYRSASEILRFAAIINSIEPNWKTNEIIDAAIMQKLLPKVHGSRRKLEPVLKTLAHLCLATGEKFEDLISPKSEIDFYDSEKFLYPISVEKILRMYKGLLDNGFTSYAEA